MPRVSIITPAYNASATLDETAASVRGQSFADWEWWIANDASTDDTAKKLEKLANDDPRVKPIFLDKNKGPAGARQAALEKAGGTHIAFLDADDLWLPKKLEEQLAFMDAKKGALSYTAYRRITEDGSATGQLINVPKSLDYNQILKNTAIACSSAIVNRSISGPFQIKNEPYHDFTTWLDVLSRGHVAHGLQKDLMRYRIRKGSDSANKLKAIKRVWHIYRNVEKLPLGKAAICLMQYGINAALKRAIY